MQNNQFDYVKLDGSLTRNIKENDNSYSYEAEVPIFIGTGMHLIANIDKQIIAGENQVKSINTIIQTIGLDNLSEQLRQTAMLRLENPESSLEELSKISGLTKSCLNHRLRKITEIANNL